MERITVEHNHGDLVLKDAELVPYQSGSYTWHRVEGTVVSGGAISRLGQFSKFRPFPVGERMSWDLFGKAEQIRKTDRGYRISMVTCG